jgi:hypothetical protein
MIALIHASFILGTASAQDLPGGAGISGKYIDPQGAFEMQLPSGWSGLELLGVAIISPEGLKSWRHPVSMGAAMMIVAINRKDLDQYGTAVQDAFSNSLCENNNLATGRCEEQYYSYVELNGLEAIQGDSECSNGGEYSRTKTYAFMTDYQMIAIAFTSNSTDAYALYEPEFDESISSLRVSKPVDIKEAMAESLGLKTEKHQVMAKGNQVELKVESNSNVSNFSFNEDAKRVSFEVKGANGTNGFAIVTIDKVLEPPYTVTVDSQLTTDFFIFEDKVDGENTIQINYEHSLHEIEIIGTNVVPEFPLAIMGLIAGILGVLAIIRTSRRDALI